jgi:hypothetical protein
MSGFWKIVERLEDHCRAPAARVSRDPFELILYENIAYLVSDDRRGQDFTLHGSRSKPGARIQRPARAGAAGLP